MRSVRVLVRVELFAEGSVGFLKFSLTGVFLHTEELAW